MVFARVVLPTRLLFSSKYRGLDVANFRASVESEIIEPLLDCEFARDDEGTMCGAPATDKELAGTETAQPPFLNSVAAVPAWQ